MPPAKVIGRVSELPAIWFRDNCRCGVCVDEKSGQKLHGILDVSPETEIEAVESDGEDLVVTVSPDGHRCVLPAGLVLGKEAVRDARSELAKTLWSADELAGSLPRVEWSQYDSDPHVRKDALSEVVRLGFVLLTGTPVARAGVLAIARTFGYVRETNYGELFDVRVEPAPTNLAFSGRGLAPHTDNPYRDPVPTLQLLHCLRNALEGGDSGLVDGYAAAALLREEDPDAFAVLTTTDVPFFWRDATASLRALRPLISLDSTGGIREIRFNNRSMQPLTGPAAMLADFYRGYRRFAEIIMRPEMRVTFRLEPGDCLVVDNTRLLHSRTAFREGGEGGRHLQGCYADLDGLLSTIEVLGGRHGTT